MLIKGIFFKKLMYFTASIAFPPPTPIKVSTSFGSSKAFVLISLKSILKIVSTLAISILASPKDFSIVSPKSSYMPSPKHIDTFLNIAFLINIPTLFIFPFPTSKIEGIAIL